MHSRRSVILAAGGASLALVGGLGVYRVTRRPRTAILPWMLPGTPLADVRLDAMRHAILAPNPHNRQPWLIRLEGSDALTISCDLNRRLPETDPLDRQTLIGFGCFLELARIAAAERGYRTTLDVFPDGLPADRLDTKPVAHLHFKLDPTVERDPLYQAILNRRTSRALFDITRSVDNGTLVQIIDMATAKMDGNQVRVKAEYDTTYVAKIRSLAVEAFTAELDLPRTYLESARLIRLGHTEIDAKPDGISLDGPLFESLQMLGQLDHHKLEAPESAAVKSGRDQQIAPYASAPAYLWVSTDGNQRAEQLASGRVYVRANLAATTFGLSMQPASQALQEYPEMQTRFQQMHTLLEGTSGGRVQMLARIGYGPIIEPSPRWPLASHIVSA